MSVTKPYGPSYSGIEAWKNQGDMCEGSNPHIWINSGQGRDPGMLKSVVVKHIAVQCLGNRLLIDG